MLIRFVQAGLILGKCFGLIDWSWFGVFAPSFIYLGIVFLVSIIVAIDESLEKSSD